MGAALPPIPGHLYRVARDDRPHAVSVEKEGLRPWQRTMTVGAGGKLTIDATLEKP